MNELRILSDSEFKKILTTNYDESTSSSDKKKKKINYHDHDDLELEKISVKRYKGADEISTRPFIRKNDKIYDHNDNHSKAKNTMIDCVNDDCLAEIFMYVPACEKPKLALVCKKWKKALDDSWFNVKKLELIYWQNDEYPNDLKKYPSVDRGYSFLKSLLDKCGRYLTKLDLTAYDCCNIVPAINDSCPNLVTLRLRFTYVDDAMLYNAFTRLSKLKSLTIIFRNIKEKLIPITLICSLLNVADTLTDLSLLNFISGYYDREDYYNFPLEINCVIPKLTALKKFEVAGIKRSRALIKYLTDSKIFICDYYRDYRQGIQSHRYDRFKKLNLSHYRVTDDNLYTIVNVMHVQELSIDCEWVTDDGVVAISKMNELHTLEFIGRNNVTDFSIKLLKNLKQLKLPISNKITDVSVTKILENSPHMETLYVENTGVTVEFIKRAADISRNRKQLLLLYYSSVTFIHDIEQYESQYFDIYMIHKEKKKKKGPICL